MEVLDNLYAMSGKADEDLRNQESCNEFYMDLMTSGCGKPLGKDYLLFRFAQEESDSESYVVADYHFNMVIMDEDTFRKAKEEWYRR